MTLTAERLTSARMSGDGNVSRERTDQLSHSVRPTPQNKDETPKGQTDKRELPHTHRGSGWQCVCL